MNPLDIDEAERLCGEATEGPWKWRSRELDITNQDETMGVECFGQNFEVDAAFIAFARSFIPAAIEEIRRSWERRRVLSGDNVALGVKIASIEKERDDLRASLKKLADAIREPNRPLYSAGYLALLVREADALRSKGEEEGA